MTTPASRQFRDAYAAHRAAEGRGAGGEAELLALPYLVEGPLARAWRVRARSYDALVRWLPPSSRRILDLGAGNGWLCYRLTRLGHRPTAVDVRTDTVDGLAAGAPYANHVPTMFDRVAATFATLPFADRSAHLAIFNAALHYADDLACALREAARVVRAGGHLVILDSPCYEDAADGEAMLREKRAKGAARFGADAPVLLAPAYVEFLTPARLAAASEPHGLVWRRHRVRYPLWYELRPWIARWRGRRAPSRFDLWTAEVP